MFCFVKQLSLCVLYVPRVCVRVFVFGPLCRMVLLFVLLCVSPLLLCSECFGVFLCASCVLI